MKWKGALYSVVAAALLLTLTAGATRFPGTGAQIPNKVSLAASTARFADIEGHWARPAIERWSGYGVIKGYGDGTTFAPNNSITRAEMAAMLSRIFGWQQKADSSTFRDISGNEWYANDILKAKAAGVMTGDGKGNARPTDSITRQDAATMISRAFRIRGSETATQFGDRSQISSWAVEAVNGMTERGFIVGAIDGNFHPWRSITRAETVTILDRIIVRYYNQVGSYSESVSGIVVVASAGVTLRDMKITGDLFIVAGAIGSEVILENVTVTGQIYVLTDQTTTVIFSNSNLQKVNVEGTNSRVTMNGSSTATGFEVSGNGSSLRGLPSSTQVTITEGTTGVKVNGHGVSAGTITAGTDISTDNEDTDGDIPGGNGNGSSKPDPSPSPSPSKPGNGSWDLGIVLPT